MILHSESDKRIIVQGTINGKKAYMLVDTGASCGLLDKSAVKEYKLAVNKYRTVNLVGAGGKFKASMCDTPFIIAGKQMYQFAIANISSVVESIKKQTDIDIAGLISLPQAKMIGMSIDTDDNYIEIGGKE